MSTETKITSLELENIKRIKAVQISPTETGLTVIGGKNGQGKTSVLDAIMWILGGERYRPSEPKREGSVTPPYGKITLSNGPVSYTHLDVYKRQGWGLLFYLYYDIPSFSFSASWSTSEKFTLLSWAASLSHSGMVRVFFTALLLNRFLYSIVSHGI